MYLFYIHYLFQSIQALEEGLWRCNAIRSTFQYRGDPLSPIIIQQRRFLWWWWLLRSMARPQQIAGTRKAWYRSCSASCSHHPSTCRLRGNHNNPSFLHVVPTTSVFSSNPPSSAFFSCSFSFPQFPSRKKARKGFSFFSSNKTRKIVEHFKRMDEGEHTSAPHCKQKGEKRKNSKVCAYLFQILKSDVDRSGWRSGNIVFSHLHHRARRNTSSTLG